MLSLRSAFILPIERMIRLFERHVADQFEIASSVRINHHGAIRCKISDAERGGGITSIKLGLGMF